MGIKEIADELNSLHAVDDRMNIPLILKQREELNTVIT